MLLEEIIHPHKLNHSVHDELIRKVEAVNSANDNILTIAMNAYYKIRNKAYVGGYLESDIDLLQLLYDSDKLPWVSDWREVPVGDAVLWLFEMKSKDSVENYHKAQKQLKRSSQMIRDYTAYQKIDCFYAFNNRGSYVLRYEQVD